MKTKNSYFALMLVTSAAMISTTAHAEPMKATATPSQMKTLDADKDGTVDLKEITDAANNHFKRLNKDGDNTLDSKELGQVGQNKKSFTQADSDKDGTVDENEYRALIEKKFKAADSDGDGTLSQKELNSKAGRSLMQLITK